MIIATHHPSLSWSASNGTATVSIVSDSPQDVLRATYPVFASSALSVCLTPRLESALSNGSHGVDAVRPIRFVFSVRQTVRMSVHEFGYGRRSDDILLWLGGNLFSDWLAGLAR